jgi:hypothetical protein
MLYSSNYKPARATLEKSMQIRVIYHYVRVSLQMHKNIGIQGKDIRQEDCAQVGVETLW